MKDNSINRQILVVERPRYTIPTANVFRQVTAPKVEARDGQVLIRTTWLGLDAQMYRRIKRFPALGEPVPLGGVMVGAAVGRVEKSNHPDFATGDLVHGFWGWQDYWVSDGTDISKLDHDIPRPSYVIGALGVSGFAAYIAVSQLLNVRSGETLIIGAALGGLGQIVGQLGKIRGARIYSAAGSPEKCRYAVEELGFDVCLNRRARDFETQVKTTYSTVGVDCYAMAMGGKVLEWAMPHFRPGGRIAVCGIMSFYALATLPPGPDKTMAVFDQIQLRRLQVRGLVTEDWLETPLHAQFKDEMKSWILSGQVKPVEHIVEGLENAPDALQGLFEGRNFGKAVVHVAD